MTWYNSSNVKLSDSQPNKLNSAVKNETEVVLRLSSDKIGDDETNFPHKLLLTNRQGANLCKAFANYLSTDIKLWKTQISKMIQSGGFLGRRLGLLLKTGLSLIKNVTKPLAKSVLILLGLTAAAPAVHKKILGLGKHPLDSASHTATLISNDEMKSIIKIVKYLEDSGLLLKRVSKKLKMKLKDKKEDFLVCY